MGFAPLPELLKWTVGEIYGARFTPTVSRPLQSSSSFLTFKCHIMQECRHKVVYAPHTHTHSERYLCCWRVGFSEQPGTRLTFCFFPIARITSTDLQPAGAPTFTGVKIPLQLTGYIQITHRPRAHLYAHLHA